MNDISTLQIRVLSADVASATQRLSQLERQAYGTERASGAAGKGIGGMVKMIAGAAVAFATASTAAALFQKIVGATKEYQVGMANLETATGSLESAQKAYVKLQQIAKTTPFSLKSAQEAFTRLVNYGLTPSERAIRSYGDAAAATNKDVVQLVEAVADAVNGEFERTKEAFNVKAKNMGDTIEFTFRGAKTVVKNNAKEIEEYFIKLGEKNFAGAMERQMKTLAGGFSAIEDAWDQMLITLGKQGIDTLVGSTLQTATGYIEQFTQYVASGAMAKSIETWTIPWQEFFKEVREGVGATGQMMAAFFKWSAGALGESEEDVKKYGDDGWGSLLRWIQQLPAAVQMFTKIATAELQAFAHKVEITITYLSKKFNSLAQQAGGALQIELQGFMDRNNLKGGQGPKMPSKFTTDSGTNSSLWAGGTNPDATLPGMKASAKSAAEAFTETVTGELESWERKWSAEETARQQIYKDQAFSMQKDALDQYGNTVARQNAARDEADQLGMVLPPKPEDYDLAQHRTGSDTPVTPTPKKTGGGGGGGRATDPLADLQRRLDKEEQMTLESLQKRLEMVDKYTADGSRAELQLTLVLIDEWEKQNQAKIEKDKQSQATMWTALAAEEQLIKDSYERRKQAILSATAVTESERARLLAEAQSEYMVKLQQNQSETTEKYIGAAKSFFGDLSKMGSAFGEKGFKVAKAAAIAEATVNTYSAAVNAYKSLSGIPYVGPALGAVAAGAAIAAGMANIAQIKAQEYTAPSGGSFAAGGIVPGTSYAGDRMNIAANSGEMVLTKQHQRQLFNMIGSGSSPNGAAPTVNIINNAGAQISQTSNKQGDKWTLEFILDAASTRFSENVTKGGTKEARALEGTYAMPRGRKY